MCTHNQHEFGICIVNLETDNVLYCERDYKISRPTCSDLAIGRLRTSVVQIAGARAALFGWSWLLLLLQPLLLIYCKYFILT